MKAQLKELTTNDMFITMFPNLNVLADVCLTIPVEQIQHLVVLGPALT